MDETDFKKLEFEKSLELRNFEISYFWKRGWFFGALVGGLVTGCFELYKDENTQEYCIYVAFLAFLSSLAQSLMNRGSKYWQERWEYKLKNKESNLGIDVTKTANYNNKERYFIDISIRSKGENWFMRSARFSVSKIAFIVWDIITISCFLLWLNQLFAMINDCESNWCNFWLFHGIIAGYVLLVRFIYGRYNFYESLIEKPDDKHEPKREKIKEYKAISERYIKNNINDCGL